MKVLGGKCIYPKSKGCKFHISLILICYTLNTPVETHKYADQEEKMRKRHILTSLRVSTKTESITEKTIIMTDIKA